jgi:hypothetical protein
VLACLVDSLAAIRKVILTRLLLKSRWNGALVSCVGGKSSTRGWHIEFLSHCCRLISVRSLRGTAIQNYVYFFTSVDGSDSEHSWSSKFHLGQW